MTKEEAIHILTAMKKSYLSLGIPDPEAVEALEMAINAVKAEPCEDSISRQAVLDIVDSYSESQSNIEDVTQDIIADIVILPHVNPVKTGHWLHRNDDYDDWLECSICGHGADGEVKYGEGSPYCPMCGAKMEKEEKP